MPNTEELLKQERSFKTLLAGFEFVAVEHPFHIFPKELKVNDLNTKNFDNESIRLLAVVEIINMLKDTDNPEIYISNVMQIFRGDNLKVYQAQLMQKGKVVKRLADELQFKVPKSAMVLQKVGQVMKGVVLRNCFMTPEAFGQFRDKKRSVLIKPNLFKEQMVAVESKKGVLERTKGGKGKDSPPLVWPDKKEVAAFTYRLFCRETLKARRERAIYIQDLLDCVNVKDNAIARRVSEKDNLLKTKIHTFKTVWKVKQTEFWYARYLQPFFRSPTVNQSIEQFSEQIRQKIRGFLKLKNPNSYESNYNPANVYDFKNNSYMVIKRPNMAIERVELNTQKALMATMISPELYIFPNSVDVLEEKKRGFLRSPFEKIEPPSVNPVELLEGLSSAFKPNPRPRTGQLSELRLTLDELFTNSKIIVRLKRVVFQDFELRKASVEEYNSLSGTALEVEVFVPKSNISAKTVGYLSALGSDLVAFDSKASLKVDSKGLQQVNVKLVDSVKKRVVTEGVFNLLEGLDSPSVENLVCLEKRVSFKGVEVSAMFCFVVYLIPRNLESAHLLTSRETIEANFDRFHEIVNTAEDFSTFKTMFYTKEVLEKKLACKSNDYFFYLKNIIEGGKNPIIVSQENLYINSFRSSNIDGLISNLFKVKKAANGFNELFLDVVNKINGNYEVDSSPFYELFIRVLNFFTPSERIFLERLLFLSKTKPYFNLEGGALGLGFHKPSMAFLEDRAGLYLRQFPFISDSERLSVQAVIFEVVLQLENNTIDGKNCRIDFSFHYIPLIVKTVLANAAEARTQDVVLLCLGRLLRSLDLQRFTDMNHVSYLDSLVALFKLLFKTMYADQYSFYLNYGIHFETLLYQGLLNSFADYLEPLQFNQYWDFKTAIEAILTLQRDRFPFLDRLAELRLSLCSLIDVLFILNAFVSNFVVFKNQMGPENFLPRIKQLFAKENFDLRRTFVKILELLDYLFYVDVFGPQFAAYKESVRERHEALISSFRNFSLNIKITGLNEKLLRSMVQSELSGNEDLQTKARSLFYESAKSKGQNDGPSQKNLSQTEIETEATAEQDRSVIFEDIFFDILNDFTLGNYQDIPADRKPLDGYTVSLAELNGMDTRVIDSFSFTRGLTPSLHNIHELDMDGLSAFVKKYFKLNDAQKLELYNDLTIIYGKSKIPLLGLLLLIIVAGSESPFEIAGNLGFFADALSGLFFAAKDRHFNEVVKFVLRELYSVLPIASLFSSLGNLVDSEFPSLRSGVKSGRISLPGDIIDITDLCVKHFNSQVFLSGRNSMLFAHDFCSDLVPIFSELLAAGAVSSELSRFELALEVFVQGAVVTHSVLFRISFEPELQIISNMSEALNFSGPVSERNLIPREVLTRRFYESPLCFFQLSTSQKIYIGGLEKPFKLKLQSGKNVYNAELKFAALSQEKSHFNVQNWAYKETVAREEGYGTVDFKLSLPFSFYLVTIKDLVAHVANHVVEHLAGDDVLKFVKKNTIKLEALSGKGKSVDLNGHLYELAEFERFTKSDEPFALVVNYKS